jgi:arginase
VTALAAHDAGCVTPPRYDRRGWQPGDGVFNAAAMARYSRRLAGRITALLDSHRFPIVLGGDCSILLGNLLALRRLERYGLLFVDGHTDFYQPSAEPDGEVASMDLALATGHGPPALADLEGRGPLVRPEDVVAFGFRDADESAEAGMQPLPARLRTIDLDGVREAGVTPAARRAVDWLSADDTSGYWVHLDADVLEDAVMPAVDHRLPGGLSWAELETVLGTAVSGDRAVGLDVTIFNPRLDPGGQIAARLAQCLHHGLITAQPTSTKSR